MKRVDNPKTPRKNGTRKTDIKQVEGVVVGRDKTVVPPEEVFRLAAMGCKDKEIAEWFGINDNTLRFNFSVELLKGRHNLHNSLRQKMIETAMQGNVVMLIYLSKNWLGMSDNGAVTNDDPLPWVEGENNEENQ